jgi:hypothetical protein
MTLETFSSGSVLFSWVADESSQIPVQEGYYTGSILDFEAVQLFHMRQKKRRIGKRYLLGAFIKRAVQKGKAGWEEMSWESRPRVNCHFWPIRNEEPFMSDVDSYI